MGVTVVIILTLLPALALLPKARAGCSNAARPDPCGGPPARAVPTATGSIVQRNRLVDRSLRLAVSTLVFDCYATTPFDFFSALYFFKARRLFCFLRLCEFFRASCFMLILLVCRDKPAGCVADGSSAARRVRHPRRT